MLDDLVDSSDLEQSEMLHPNSQNQCNSTSNIRDDNNPLIGQEEYRKRRGIKGNKACKGR